MKKMAMHQLIEDFLLACKLEGKNIRRDQAGPMYKTRCYIININSSIIEHQDFYIFNKNHNGDYRFSFLTYEDVHTCENVYLEFFKAYDIEWFNPLVNLKRYDGGLVKINLIGNAEYIYDKLCRFEDIVREIEKKVGKNYAPVN